MAQAKIETSGAGAAARAGVIGLRGLLSLMRD
jgi:hypothetical protein